MLSGEPLTLAPEPIRLGQSVFGWMDMMYCHGLDSRWGGRANRERRVLNERKHIKEGRVVGF